MVASRVVLAFLIAFIGAFSATADGADDEIKKLEGMWTVESSTLNRNAVKNETRTVFVFADGTLTILYTDGTEKEMAFNLDPTGRTKIIEFAPELQVQARKLPPSVKWAYEVDGDTLKMAVPGTGKRPSGVTDAGQTLLILKRAAWAVASSRKVTESLRPSDGIAELKVVFRDTGGEPEIWPKFAYAIHGDVGKPPYLCVGVVFREPPGDKINGRLQRPVNENSITFFDSAAGITGRVQQVDTAGISVVDPRKTVTGFRLVDAKQGEVGVLKGYQWPMRWQKKGNDLAVAFATNERQRTFVYSWPNDAKGKPVSGPVLGNLRITDGRGLTAVLRWDPKVVAK